jgi:hypothetical protein
MPNDSHIQQNCINCLNFKFITFSPADAQPAVLDEAAEDSNKAKKAKPDTKEFAKKSAKSGKR